MNRLAKWVPLAVAILFASAAGAQYQDPYYPRNAQPYPAAAQPHSQQGAQPQQGAPQPFAQAELDQMLAPIALYPDSLLSQILMASTYPDQVEQAAAWSRANPGLNGEEAVRAVQNQPWDPSVISLVAFPQVLAQMSQQKDWTFRLGQAYMTMSAQMMDSIQGLRARADQNGNLQSNDQRLVEQQGGNYMIQPPNPEVMQVPYYDPREVYGQWAYPGYQPVYWDPWPNYWGYGIALGAGFFFGAFDWHNHYIHYSNYRPWYYHGNNWHGGQRWAHNGSHNGSRNGGSHGGNSNRWQTDRGNWDRRAQANGGQAWRGGQGQRWQGNSGGQAQRVQSAGVNPAARPQYRMPGYQTAQQGAGQQRAAQQGEVARTYRAQRGPVVREAGVARAATSGRQVVPQRTREASGNPAARSSEQRGVSRPSTSSSSRSSGRSERSQSRSESRGDSGRGRDR